MGVDEKRKMIYPICSVVAVFKMLVRILNTATTEQMGYRVFPFFVYTKSTNQKFYFFLLSHRDIKNTWCDFMLERKSPFVCSVNGAKEISIENYGSLGDFSDKKIVLNCYKCKMIIEGEGLLIEYFTDVDMKITGHIHSIHF